MHGSVLSTERLSLAGAGELQPLPAQVYPLNGAVVAMRELAAARHIGKVVLQAAPCLPQPRKASGGGRWVVTGGTGALGALAGTAKIFCLLEVIIAKSLFVITRAHCSCPCVNFDCQAMAH